MIYWIAFLVIITIGCGLICYAVSSAAREGEELGELFIRQQIQNEEREG